MSIESSWFQRFILIDGSRVLDRARERCAQHRVAPGVCRECALAEVHSAVAARHPELDPDEVASLIEEWTALAGEDLLPTLIVVGAHD